MKKVDPTYNEEGESFPLQGDSSDYDSGGSKYGGSYAVFFVLNNFSVQIQDLFVNWIPVLFFMIYFDFALKFKLAQFFAKKICNFLVRMISMIYLYKLMFTCYMRIV